MDVQELMGLPVAVDVPTAGRVLGLSKNTAYRLVRDGTFPLPVIRAGGRLRVPRAAIFHALGVTAPGSSLAAASGSNAVTPLAMASDL